MANKLYKDVEVGDVIDGVKITDVEKDSWHLTFTFDLIGGGWSFLVVYPCDYGKEAKFVFPKRKENDDEESEQLDFFDEMA